MKELKEALIWNYDKGLDAQSAGDIGTEILKAMKAAGRNVDASTAAAVLNSLIGMKPEPDKLSRFKEIHDMIDEVPKFGNDIPEVDYFAREVAYTYTKPLQNYKNPRGGQFQAGLYPVSANVPLGGQTGATPDGRYAHTPVADGVSPSAGKDVKGPTAAASSVARLDHFIVSNGTLFNQKFHPSALSGREGLEKFVALIRSYFDQKGMHMQFNVVDRQTLLMHRNILRSINIWSYVWLATVRCLQHFPDLCRMILSAVQSRDFNREGKTWTIWIQRAGCLMSSDILSMTDLE